ncbi:MAG TPA: hypothetical protein VGE20_14815 [Ramlibacter sp.]
MSKPLAASIIDFVMGLALAPADQESSNRFSLEGLSLRAVNGGALEVGIQRLTAASLRVASGPLMVELEHLAVHKVVASVRIEGGRPRLQALEAAGAELAGVKVQAPLTFARPPGGQPYALHVHGGAAATADVTSRPPSTGPWCLDPLGDANGTIRAEIIDAHLLFDADVTVPIREGRVDFNAASVEHVGPDSRMGVSRLGLYVDAPNGRSYLYQFPSAPVAGVEFERRGAALGPWVTDRGRLLLQAFGEGLLRQCTDARGAGLTEQARLLFDRTALSGEVRLGDGRFCVPGVQGETSGRAEGRNAIRLHSEAVGRGVTVEMASLLVRNAVLGVRNAGIACDEIAGALRLRLFVGESQVGFAFELANMKIAALRLEPDRPASA